jgi:hypothetical protein
MRNGAALASARTVCPRRRRPQPSGAATAQNVDQQRCLSDPDHSISGCIGMIQSGHETQEKLAIDFYDRGTSYARKGQYDRAIEDLDQAIRSTRITPWPSTTEASPTRATASSTAPLRTWTRRSGSTRISPKPSTTGAPPTAPFAPGIDQPIAHQRLQNMRAGALARARQQRRKEPLQCSCS